MGVSARVVAPNPQTLKLLEPSPRSRNMTLNEATALVENLIDAVYDCEQALQGYRSDARLGPRARYLSARQRILTALTESSQAARSAAGDDTPAG
jgi:hypothetical protein